MADKYVLRVTAGPDYDIDTHVQVHVNQPSPLTITSAYMDIELNVRVQGYKGLPPNSPTTSPYFDQEPHLSNQDQYSIAFRFTPKRPTSNEESSSGEGEEGIPGTDLQFGNDFDHPIRDSLPPGINAGLNILKWFIDPGLEGDVYADRPYLYGPALSSFNVVHLGNGCDSPEKGGLWFEEGASPPSPSDDGDDEEGQEYRARIGCPPDAKGRMKWALNKQNIARWTWQYGRTYGADFFNPYVDFGELSIRLPGFHLPVVRYWDGKTGLRYVLRNRSTGRVYLVVLFTLHLREDVNEDGSLKAAALKAVAEGSGEGGGRGGKDEAVDGDKGTVANGSDGGGDDDID